MAVATKRKPSRYQEDIIQFALSGNGDGFVDAVAGSGKTTTLEMVAQELGRVGTKALFLAFNKHISIELKKRLEPFGHNVSTIHGIGFSCVKKFLNGVSIRIEDYKYQEIIRILLKEAFVLDPEEERTTSSAIYEIFKFVRSSLINPSDKAAIKDVIDHYGLDIPNQFTLEAAFKLLPSINKGGEDIAKRTGLISYCDMLWLPHAFNITPWQYNYVLVDEAQDLSAAQLELAMKCRRNRGRMIFVGDERQAIYGFAGSDTQSVARIISKTNSKRFPLSVCYRCPKTHIDLAKNIVPSIEPAENASDGIIKNIPKDSLIKHVRANDLILCRTTTPLVSTAFELIGAGIPARIKGKDIGKGLIAIIKKVTKQAEQAGRQIKIETFLSELNEYERKSSLALSGTKNEDSKIQRLMDQCSSLRAILSFSKPANLNDFCKIVDEMFSDEKTSVTLSTVHRAKGLEEDRVFILEPKTMPHPMAKSQWEREQEMNIKYVALTRAKKELLFVD